MSAASGERGKRRQPLSPPAHSGPRSASTAPESVVASDSDQGGLGKHYAVCASYPARATLLERVKGSD